MKNLQKLKVIFLIFTIVLASEAIAADQILPVSKPTPDKETKIKVEQKKYIYPKKKPALKKQCLKNKVTFPNIAFINIFRPQISFQTTIYSGKIAKRRT